MTSRRHRVAVLVRDGVIPLEMSIPLRLFGQARSAAGTPLYEVTTCALRPGQVRTDTDIGLVVPHGPEVLSRADTVVVPASDQDFDPATQGVLEPELAAALGRIRSRTRIASICTGSFVLAAAGLLDGGRATTHWRSAADFRKLFPAVQLDPDVLYTDAGRVLTAAGLAAGLDLCLHMIRCDHGAAVANEVARGSVIPPHREGGQAQYIEHPVPELGDTPTAAARGWALRHLDRPLTLAELAEVGGVSPRTFTRRFRAETGLSPMAWLSAQRLQRARELLERSALSVDQIAEQAGFGTATAMRQHFRAGVGVSPSTYRETFRR